MNFEKGDRVVVSNVRDSRELCYIGIVGFIDSITCMSASPTVPILFRIETNQRRFLWFYPDELEILDGTVVE